MQGLTCIYNIKACLTQYIFQPIQRFLTPTKGLFLLWRVDKWEKLGRKE